MSISPEIPVDRRKLENIVKMNDKKFLEDSIKSKTELLLCHQPSTQVSKS